MLGVTDSRAKLWIDCQPVQSVHGYIENPLEERGQYDAQDGFLSIAQIADNRRTYQVNYYQLNKMIPIILLMNIFSFFPSQTSPAVRRLEWDYNSYAREQIAKMKFIDFDISFHFFILD